MASTRKSEPSLTADALAALLFQHWDIPGDAAFVAAYSGGLDSSVLLHLLVTLRSAYPFSLRAVHIDHRLHPRSCDWGIHGEQVCRELAVPFSLYPVTVNVASRDGMEAAARCARYEQLAAVLQPGEFLLTAHHQDDQAETVLLQLLRGAGVAGMAAIPARTAFGQGELLRPLLDYPRRAVRQYAIEHALAWIEDPSNADLRWRRNFIRSEVLPRLQGHWPEAMQALARAARHAAEAQSLLDDIAGNDLHACQDGTTGRYPFSLSTTAIQQLPVSRQRNLLRYWLRLQNFLSPDTRHLQQLIHLVSMETRTHRARLHWQGVEVWKYRNQLVALPHMDCPPVKLDVPWDLDLPLHVPNIGRLTAVPTSGTGLSRERLLQDGLRVRLRHGGECLRLPGRQHRHSLKKLLQANGVPPWERQRLPLFYTAGELVAVADRWVSADYVADQSEPAVQIVWDPCPLTGSCP